MQWYTPMNKINRFEPWPTLLYLYMCYVFFGNPFIYRVEQPTLNIFMDPIYEIKRIYHTSLDFLLYKEWHISYIVRLYHYINTVFLATHLQKKNVLEYVLILKQFSLLKAYMLLIEIIFYFFSSFQRKSFLSLLHQKTSIKKRSLTTTN